MMSICLQLFTRRRTFSSLLVAIIVVTHNWKPVSALGATPISVESSLAGTTVNAERGQYSNFTAPNIGGGGQTFFILEVTDDGATELDISTCNENTSFDTYLVVFDGLEILPSNVIQEADDDASCSILSSLSTLSISVRRGNYTILVTGSGTEEGEFTLSVSKLANFSRVLPWGLDRIDQRTLPLDGRYSISKDDQGTGVTVYVLDSGIRRTHRQLEGRVDPGFDYTTNLSPADEDCSGSGTHVSGIIGGVDTGVAKNVTFVPVRVLDCENKGSVANVVAGLQWILDKEQSTRPERKHVIVYLRFLVDKSEQLDNIVRIMVRRGIPVIVPAGDNGDGTICETKSPATSGVALVVGATDSDDTKSSFSNFGPCVNLFAPGRDIASSAHISDTGVWNRSGTAQAAAHVAGMASLLGALNSNVEPGTLTSILTSVGTVGVVRNSTGNGGSGGTSRLAFVRSVPSIVDDAPPTSFVFIYMIATFMNIPMLPNDSCGAIEVNRQLARHLRLKDDEVTTRCYEVLRRQENNSDILIRFSSPVRQASFLVSQIETMTQESDRESSPLGYSFTVRESLWFVDSNNVTFWSEPQFEDIASNGLSTGALVGLIVGIFVCVAIVSVFGYTLYRKASHIDDIQSMEGSADFEKGPAHFNDFAQERNEDSSAQGSRSFRNVMNAIGRSASMRRGMSRHGVGGGDDEAGVSRMDSYVGVRGAQSGGGTDMTRMRSYGGEAFAGLGGISRGNSVKSDTSQGRDIQPAFAPGGNRIASFRGAIPLGNARGAGAQGATMNDGNDSLLGNVRMRSMGGEAFAMIARQLSINSGRSESSAGVAAETSQSQRVKSDTSSGPCTPLATAQSSVVRTESFGAEALAKDTNDPQREDSYFQGNQ